MKKATDLFILRTVSASGFRCYAFFILVEKHTTSHQTINESHVLHIMFWHNSCTLLGGNNAVTNGTKKNLKWIYLDRTVKKLKPKYNFNVCTFQPTYLFGTNSCYILQVQRFIISFVVTVTEKELSAFLHTPNILILKYNLRMQQTVYANFWI